VGHDGHFEAILSPEELLMSLVLYPRAAPNDRLRVWMGAFQHTQPPLLTWKLDGIPRAPTVLQPIRSVRTDDMLPAPDGTPGIPRVFSGVYEFPGLTPDTRYAVTVQTDRDAATIEARTLPSAVPSGFDRWFNVLLVSCFHQAEDRGGLAGRMVSQLTGVQQPHLSVLMGDQVYLDLPTLQDFPDDLAWLAAKFEADYGRNWQGPPGYGQVLAAAPSVAIPDDHEYWNNFPHTSPAVGNSWNPAGRARWRQAAEAMYAGFQLPSPVALEEALILDVPPLSFCLMNTRSGQQPDLTATVSGAVLQQLNDWAVHVIDLRYTGVFVTGQSLFVTPTTALGGAVVDHELPDYGDFHQLIAPLIHLIDERRPVLCLTGDVHWGRVVAAQDIRTGRTSLYEVISSPSSLVTTVGRDQLNELGAFITGLFGAADPWPRHADAEAPPAFWAHRVGQGRFPCTALHRQRGNHVVLLSFRQTGGGLDFRITYWPLHPSSQVNQPTVVGPFHLPGSL
jgi:hypothetical protein